MVRTWLGFFMLLSMFSESPARAALCAAIGGGAPELGSRDSSERLRFIRAGLNEDAGEAARWATGWGIGWSAVTAAQLAFALGPRSRDDRIDLLVEAGASALGTLPTLVFRPGVIARASSLEAASDDSCARLATAEEALLESAREERLETGWLAYAGNVAFNAGLTLGLGFGFQHWGTAVISSAAGIPLGSLMIATRPRGSIDLLQRYREGRLAASSPSRAGELRISVARFRASYGMQLGWSF